RMVLSENNSCTNMILCQLNLDAFTLTLNHHIKSVSIGIIPIFILDLCVNGRESLVRGGPTNSLFFTADEGR
ncbi:hypothetical protein QUA81_33070, partial [Microcoleus sp. F6_B4]